MNSDYYEDNISNNNYHHHHYIDADDHEEDTTVDRNFEQHVESLRATMFYVCQGSCLCGTVNNRGKVIYCYGDLVPRHGELFAEGNEGNGGTSSKDLLAAQLGVWAFGIIALLIVLLLIRKSIGSLKRQMERFTERLPVYHDDEVLSTNSTTSPHMKDKSEKSVSSDQAAVRGMMMNNHLMIHRHLDESSSDDHDVDVGDDDGGSPPPPPPTSPPPLDQPYAPQLRHQV